MSERLPLIAFLVGVLAGDVSFRFIELATYQIVLVIALLATALLYATSGMHELIRDAAFPLVGGFAASGVIKWIFATMLS